MIRTIAILFLVQLVSSNVYDTDFESGLSSYWSARSYAQGISLALKDAVGGPAPVDGTIGTKYLATAKSAAQESGTALYTSTGFINNGVVLTLDYWMKSQWDQGDVLEIFYQKSGVNILLQRVLSSLADQNRWKSIRVPIPADVPYTVITITLYVSGNDGDTAAIDNIKLLDALQTSTTAAPASTTITTKPTTTAEPTTTTTTPVPPTTEPITTQETTTATEPSTLEVTTRESTTEEPITSPHATVTPSTVETTESFTTEEETTATEDAVTLSTITPSDATVTPSTVETTESFTTEEESTATEDAVTSSDPETTESTLSAEVTSEVPDVSTTAEPSATSEQATMPDTATPETAVPTETTDDISWTSVTNPETTDEEISTVETTPPPTETDGTEETTVELTSTSEPHTTTVEPETTVVTDTTVIRTTTTTAAPASNNATFNFGTSTSAWSLNEGNGAAWIRSTDAATVPAGVNGYLWLKRSGFYSGILTTESPLLKADGAYVTVVIEFWVNGSRTDPALLQVYTKSENYVYGERPVIDLNGFGNSPNPNWTKFSLKTPVTQTDGLFQLVIQGSLGQSLTNKIAIASVKVYGAAVVNWPSFWDVGSGKLNGWTTGTSQGAHWRLADESDSDVLNIPFPEEGQKFIMVEKYTARPGFVTMQSPLMTLSVANPRLGISFWVRGSRTSPAELTIRLRSEDGELTNVPVLDLRSFGASDTLSWVYVDAPLSTNLSSYQVVIEAFVGVAPNNGIAVSDLLIVAFEDGKMLRRSILF